MCSSYKYAMVASPYSPSPRVSSLSLSWLLGCLSMCWETEWPVLWWRQTGSFKYRGASNFVLQLTEEQRKNGVVTHSSGNHAQALACAAHTHGVHGTYPSSLHALLLLRPCLVSSSPREHCLSCGALTSLQCAWVMWVCISSSGGMLLVNLCIRLCECLWDCVHGMVCCVCLFFLFVVCSGAVFVHVVCYFL